MRRHCTIAVCVIFLLLLTGCKSTESIEEPTSEPIDYVSTVEALQSENETATKSNDDMQEHIEDLENQITDLQGQLTALEEDIAENELTITTLNDEVEDELSQKENEQKKAKALYDIFIAVTGDQMGEYVLCTDAYEDRFEYENKLSMRTELEEYVAGYTGVNPNSVSSTHQMIWSNTDDGLIKVFAGGYMYPFIVRFENPDFGAKNSVYSLTSGCYVDFPTLEQEIREAYWD